MTIKLAVFGMSGGSGKTTTAVNLAAALARLGMRVLLIDMDSRAHATLSLGVFNHHSSTIALLKGDIGLDEAFLAISSHPQFFFIPGAFSVTGAGSLWSMLGSDQLLVKAIEGATGLDFVIMDCSPTSHLLLKNALSYATHVVIPTKAEALACHSLLQSLDVLEEAKSGGNPMLEIGGVLLTHYDAKRSTNQEFVAAVHNLDGLRGRVLETRIRHSASLAMAPLYKKDIFQYRPKSVGAEDYLSLAIELQKNLAAPSA